MLRFSFLFFILLSLLVFFEASAQDTLLLINGKTINAQVLEVKESAIKYRVGDHAKIHSISTERIFSINKGDGTEQIIFKPDTLEKEDYTVDQMRLFIKGEQAGRAGYHNNLNKGAALVIGAGASYFSIYGLVLPALYSSIVGAKSPDIYKQKDVDPKLESSPDYQDGYLKIARDKKIKNSYVAGMIGFVAAFAAQAIISHNSK